MICWFLSGVAVNDDKGSSEDLFLPFMLHAENGKFSCSRPVITASVRCFVRLFVLILVIDDATRYLRNRDSSGILNCLAIKTTLHHTRVDIAINAIKTIRRQHKSRSAGLLDIFLLRMIRLSEYLVVK